MCQQFLKTASYRYTLRDAVTGIDPAFRELFPIDHSSICICMPFMDSLTGMFTVYSIKPETQE